MRTPSAWPHVKPCSLAAPSSAFVQTILNANPRYGPVFLIKVDIADGFYRVWGQLFRHPQTGCHLPNPSRLRTLGRLPPGPPHGLDGVTALLLCRDRDLCRPRQPTGGLHIPTPPPPPTIWTPWPTQPRPLMKAPPCLKLLRSPLDHSAGASPSSSPTLSS